MSRCPHSLILGSQGRRLLGERGAFKPKEEGRLGGVSWGRAEDWRMSVLMGQLGGLALGSGQPYCDAPFTSSVLSEALPAPGSTDVNSLALAVCVESSPVAADPFPGKGLGRWRNSLGRRACCHAAIGTCSQGPRALSPVPQACFRSVAVVPERTGWSGHVDVPHPQAGCSQDPRRGDGSLDPGLCRMCPCRCRL